MFRRRNWYYYASLNLTSHSDMTSPTERLVTVSFLILTMLSGLLPGQTVAQTDQRWQALVPETPFDFHNASPEPIIPLRLSKKPWKLCALYPHLKDSYWLSVNYGMAEQARQLGVSLKVFAADGYVDPKPQIQQIQACMSWQADAILLGSISYQALQPELSEIGDKVPVFGLVNNILPDNIIGKVGVDWYMMGLKAGKFLAEKHPQGSKPVTVAWFSSPVNRGGSSASERGLMDALSDSAITVVTQLHGDNDKSVKREMVQQVLDAYPNIDYLVGGAIMAEVAVSELHLRKQQDKTNNTRIVSTYLSHGVYRGLLRRKIEMANSDQMVLQGRMSVDQAVRYLEGKPFIRDFGPEIISLTPDNLDSVILENSLSPANYRPVFEVNQ